MPNYSLSALVFANVYTKNKHVNKQTYKQTNKQTVYLHILRVDHNFRIPYIV